jgi:nicotinamidase-related amidase
MGRMTKALIVVDVQESFRQRASWETASDPEVAVQVGRLVDHFRARGDLIVWVLHNEPGTGDVFDPQLGFVRLMDGLVAKDGEPTVHKTSHNAFTTTNLHQLLTARGIREVTVCGIRTEQCCETTARVASDLGFGVVFAIDATATTPIELRGEVLSTQEILRRTEFVLAGRFATIATVAELTGS